MIGREIKVNHPGWPKEEPIRLHVNGAAYWSSRIKGRVRNFIILAKALIGWQDRAAIEIVLIFMYDLNYALWYENIQVDVRSCFD